MPKSGAFCTQVGGVLTHVEQGWQPLPLTPIHLDKNSPHDAASYRMTDYIFNPQAMRQVREQIREKGC